MSETTQPPLRAAIIPVTAFEQNCSLIWCTKTMRGALVDAGGDLDRLKLAVAKAGVTLEKLLVTHGHMDHCGMTGVLAKELSLPIEGPHEDDRFWIESLDDPNKRYGLDGESFEPDRWLTHGDTVTVGEVTLDVVHCPGHTPGHVVFDRADRLPQGQSSGSGRFDHPAAVAARRRRDVPAGAWPDQHLRPRACDEPVRGGRGVQVSFRVNRRPGSSPGRRSFRSCRRWPGPRPRSTRVAGSCRSACRSDGRP
jgi:hypothetical protein